jgi:lipopolysaccharide biosynthesis regulator YciM
MILLYMKIRRTFSKSKQYIKRTIHRIKKAYKKTTKRMRKGMRNRLSSKRNRNTKRKKKRVLSGGDPKVHGNYEAQETTLIQLQDQGEAYREGDQIVDTL